MKILVTGGAGFIGSHTCDRLLELGHDVMVLDALTQPRSVISLGAASFASAFLAVSDLPISSCFMVFCDKASTEQASAIANRFKLRSCANT